MLCLVPAVSASSEALSLVTGRLSLVAASATTIPVPVPVPVPILVASARTPIFSRKGHIVTHIAVTVHIYIHASDTIGPC
jgi:hypothetical protein